MSEDNADYVLKSGAWDGAQASYRKGFAAGRLAGLREAAEVAREFDNIQSECSDGAEVAKEITAAILARAEGKEG